MRIGLISDTHIPEAREELWPQVFDVFRGVSAIFHAGDIYDIGVIDQLGEVAPVYAARGNGDDGSSGRKVQPADPRLKEVWLMEYGGVRIGLTHYIPMPELPPHLTVSKWIQRLYPEMRPDVLIYGDTHVEQIGLYDGVLCVNPGSPTFPHNLNVQYGTVGFLDIADGKAEASIWQLTMNGVVPFDWENSRRPW